MICISKTTAVIDNGLRSDLADDLSRFLAGRSTNRELLTDNPSWDSYAFSNDAGVSRIAETLASWFGDEARIVRLEGTERSGDRWGEHVRALEPRERKALDRCMLFLRSDVEYPWSEPAEGALRRYLSWLLAIISFGLLSRLLWRDASEVREAPLWPFRTQEAYDQVMKNNYAQ